MTHHVIIQAKSRSGKTELDPSDYCAVGIHYKDLGAGIKGSSREWRTSPILLFVEHNNQNYAYTTSGSLYQLGEQIGLMELLEMVPGIQVYL